MIVGVRRDLRGQAGEIVDRLRIARERERALRALDLRIASPSPRAAPASAASASSIRLARDQRARPAGRYAGIVGRHLGDLVEDRQRALGVALGQHLLAHGDQRLELGLAPALPRS